MLRLGYQGIPIVLRQPAPPSLSPITRSQPPHGYSEVDKYERRIESEKERMMRENKEKMLRTMT